MTSTSERTRPARVQYARTTAEAAALIRKNGVDIWAPLDAIRERVEDLALEGEDLDCLNLKGLIRIMRNAELDGADLAERITEEGFNYWSDWHLSAAENEARRTQGRADYMEKAREALA